MLFRSQQYAKYVGSQGKSLSTLVTEMRLDSDSDTPKLTFKPVRFLSREEWVSAKEKGESPAAKAAVVMVPAQLDGAKKLAVAAPAASSADVEEVQEPVKRPSKKAADPVAKKDFADVLQKWTDD